MNLRISSPESEGVYQGSKWIKFQVLCDPEELGALFERLQPVSIYPLTGLVDGNPLSPETFLGEYRSWIEGLQAGKIPNDSSLRKVLAAAFVDDPEALWLQEIPGKGYLAKIGRPVLQVQAHWFTYSEEDKIFRPMSMGLNSVFWGLQFSYPGIYQDAKTMELKEVEDERIFETVRLWVREMTRATPFITAGQRINSPIRLGRNAFSWIGKHPQLLEQGISIHGS